MAQGKIFTRENLLLHPDDLKTQYQPNKIDKNLENFKNSRKDLLLDIEFITNFVDLNAENIVVYYDLHTPGQHINVLSGIFLNIEWRVYGETSRFSKQLRNNNKVIIKDKFTKFIKVDDNKDVYYINNNAIIPEKLSDDQEVVENYVEQIDEILSSLNPVASSFNFRLPYFKTPEGQVAKKKIDMMGGYLFKQPYGKKSSDLTRLTPIKNDDDKYLIVSYDTEKYDNQLFHHNLIVRLKDKYKNIFTGDLQPYSEDLNNSYDVTAEMMILNDLLKKLGEKPNQQVVVGFSRYLTKNLQD